MSNFKKSAIGILNWIRFFLTSRKVFGGNSPALVLKVIELFVTLEAPLYNDSMYLGRSVPTSVKLFQNLVKSYLETKSEVTLSQIMTVLKEEIIEREQNNGRKQFQGRQTGRSSS